MFRILWTPPATGAVHPLIPGTAADGRSCYFRGAVVDGHLGILEYQLPDTPRNRSVVAALPASFEVEEAQPEPAPDTEEREEIIARLREVGIPHRKNEKLETLKRKLAHDQPTNSVLR